MCGIFALLSRNYLAKYTEKGIYQNFYKVKPRGPDLTITKPISPNLYFGFHRLAINDLSPAGNQPMTFGGTSEKNDHLHLICNGEIFNYAELNKKYNFKPRSHSDCEVILHLYKEFGIERVVNEIDGDWAFVLYDQKKDVLYAARDPIGVRPLFIGYDVDRDGIFFSSEAKGIFEYTYKQISQFPPGHYWTSESPKQFHRWWHLENGDNIKTEAEALQIVHDTLTQATIDRLLSERQIGCFLSGGLDSSLITALVNKYNSYKVNTYSIGMEGGTDIYYANKVAEFVKTNHHVVSFTPEEGIAALEHVIYMLESYDVTTIRASIGMYLLSKHISEKSNDIVIYSGEGSDEVTQGYLYFHNAPDPKASAIDSKRLVDNLHYFDVLRVDRCVAGCGLEVRVPFLGKRFIQSYFQLDPKLRIPTYKGIEKYLIRKAFENDNLLPKEVLWRVKEAFSDGISSLKKPWHQTLGEMANKMISDDEFARECQFYKENGMTVPIHKEALYYRKIYNKLFKKEMNLIPYYWMPQWSNATDPSARTISKYTQLMSEEMNGAAKLKQ